MIENPASVEQEFQFGFVMAKTALISNVTLSSSTGNVIKSTADASQWAHCFLTYEPENSTTEPGNMSRKMSHRNGDANGNDANGQHHANGHHANGNVEDHQTNNAKKPAFKTEEDCKAVLEKAVIRRCMADVEIGLLLSGGLDSSILGALMTQPHIKKHLTGLLTA